MKKVKGPSNNTFWEWVHKEFNDYTKLDRRLQWELKRKWDEIQDYYQSTNGENYCYPHIKAQENLDESLKEDELGDYLNKDDYSKFVNNEEEKFTKRKCQLPGIAYRSPPTMILEKFEVIKYSLGTYEEYVAIKAVKCDQLTQSEENVAQLYENIFRMNDEGWDVTRTK